MTNQSKTYFQSVKSSGRTFGFLGLMLGATAGSLTGVAVKGLVGDPVVSGGGAVAFYVAFAASSLITLYVMFNFLTMSLRISGDTFRLGLGMKSASVDLTRIKAVRVAETKSRMTRVAAQAKSGGQKISSMWSVMGVGSGIEMDVARADDPSGTTELWFISSNDPEALAERLSRAISADSTDDQTPED